MEAWGSEAAVEAREVAFSYGARRALAGVSFTVGRGEVFGFLGPNGGGKSTLFKVLATLLPLQAGTVSVLGRDLAAEPRAVRRRLGVLFQSPGLDLELTCRENLLHHGHLYGLRGGELARRLDQALVRFGLAGRRGEKVRTLSGGLRRRLEIAKALLHGPELLLLDEPSTGLDPGARRELGSILEELSGEGVTVLLTTHFIEEGDRCHRLALLDGGRIVARGAPEELKREIGGDVVTLTSRQPEALAGELARRFGVEARPVPGEAGAVRFSAQGAHRRVAEIAAALQGRFESVTVARPSLEDVFLRHTGHSLWRGEETVG